MELVFLKSIPNASQVQGAETYKKFLAMGFEEDDVMIGKPIDFVFLGSCTNGRIEDFRAFTEIVKDVKKQLTLPLWLVPDLTEEQIKRRRWRHEKTHKDTDNFLVTVVY
jgi:3-isopropylmalate/(R)-2-methylmalate dehydratase large subunit